MEHSTDPVGWGCMGEGQEATLATTVTLQCAQSWLSNQTWCDLSWWEQWLLHAANHCHDHIWHGCTAEVHPSQMWSKPVEAMGERKEGTPLACSHAAAIWPYPCSHGYLQRHCIGWATGHDVSWAGDGCIGGHQEGMLPVPTCTEDAAPAIASHLALSWLCGEEAKEEFGHRSGPALIWGICTWTKVRTECANAPRFTLGIWKFRLASIPTNNFFKSK